MQKKATILIFVFVVTMFAIPYAFKNKVDFNFIQKPKLLKFFIPKNWPIPNNIFANNPLTEEGFQLGKKLFYDGRLSKDGNFACASCHQQFAAFATYDHDFSHGFNNSFTTRNAPPLFNLAWMPLLQWDGGINHIEVQPLSPILAPNEMAEDLNNVLIKLKKDSVYPKMFAAAFESKEINSQKMLKALAQFTGSILSYNSKYDKVKKGETQFTNAEQNGYKVFKDKCQSCHKEPLFTDNSFRNNGLSVNIFLKDYGRMKITGDASDSLKFKVPSLRNVAVTFPYMHDGRINSLSKVIDHYRSGIIITQPTLDFILKKRITISDFEKNNLIYFLYTLTDSTLLKDTRFAQGQ